MNATGKKLLSWLIVVTMVLSMVPALDLSNFAVTTKAAELGSANLSSDVQSIITEAAKVKNDYNSIQGYIDNGTCPMCGESGITWTRMTKRLGNDQVTTDGSKYHFYYAGEINAATWFLNNTGRKNTTVCIALMPTALIKQTTNRSMLGHSTNTVNIMGSGTIMTELSDTANDWGLFQVDGGTLNLYGGNYIHNYKGGNTGLTANYMQAAIRIGASGTVNVYNDAKIGPETVDTTKANYNVYNLGTFNMYGGTVRNGVADVADASGNVNVYGGTFNMYGGKVEDGQYKDGFTKCEGGNLQVRTGCTANIYGGTISGGKAYRGGNVFAHQADVNMSGGTISSGTGTTAADNVFLRASDMIMSGNAVVYSSDNGAGSAVYVLPYGKVVSKLILSGNATVKSANGSYDPCIDSQWSEGANNNMDDDLFGQVILANDWVGEAYARLQVTASIGQNSAGTSFWSNMRTLTRGEAIPEKIGYCGTLNADGTVTKGGSFSGRLYYSPVAHTGICGTDGNLNVGMAGVITEDGELWYATNQAAVDAYNGEGYVLVGSAAELNVGENADIYIDCRDFNMTIHGTGKVHAMHMGVDDYKGRANWTVDEGIEMVTDVTNPVNGVRYVVIKNTDEANAGTYSAYRIEVKMTHVVLRTGETSGDYSAPGLYYKTEIKCDTALANRVRTYGVVLKLGGMPDANFLADSTAKYTEIKGLTRDENQVCATTSGLLTGILKEVGTDERTAAQNAQYAEMDVFANVYLAVDVEGTNVVDDFVQIMGSEENAKSYSLLDVIGLINNKWSELEQAQQEMMQDFVGYWLSRLEIAEDRQDAWNTALSNIVEA